jgi:hypothetical protein
MRFRKLNTSPGTIDGGYDLKSPLTTPLIKKIDLVFPTGIEVTARNTKGVTIRDALDAIHKVFKKKVLSLPVHHLLNVIPITDADEA